MIELSGCVLRAAIEIAAAALDPASAAKGDGA